MTHMVTSQPAHTEVFVRMLDGSTLSVMLPADNANVGSLSQILEKQHGMFGRLHLENRMLTVDEKLSASSEVSFTRLHPLRFDGVYCYLREKKDIFRFSHNGTGEEMDEQILWSVFDDIPEEEVDILRFNEDGTVVSAYCKPRSAMSEFLAELPCSSELLTVGQGLSEGRYTLRGRRVEIQTTSGCEPAQPIHPFLPRSVARSVAPQRRTYSGEAFVNASEEDVRHVLDLSVETEQLAGKEETFNLVRLPTIAGVELSGRLTHTGNDWQYFFMPFSAENSSL
mmetsp:Transcript_130411/g.226610  ORF Transcript_130411/g.226610 Transcript_130411/m.226610 type:complete len:282 (+) Transcript_130411:155-1000(+)